MVGWAAAAVVVMEEEAAEAMAEEACEKSKHTKAQYVIKLR